MRSAAVVLLVLAACRSTPAAEPVGTAVPPAPADAPPKKVKVITETQIEILDPIKFLPGSPTLDPASIPILDATASTLIGNTSIQLIAVQAFGPDTVATLQLRLGTDRAQAIIDALVARGVDRKRLVAEGYAQPHAGRPNIPIFLILKRSD